ncbi:MAG: four helix bundle protein [Phycisphaerales bacterium]|nr:four helix bundle protein [Phycisphaerales bacterium]
MAAIKGFRDLVAWQKAMELCKVVYTVSRLFPDNERFGLTAQIRRAVISVPSNIAEGYARASTGDYVRFLGIAGGSLAEVETQLILAQELGFLPADQLASCFELLGESNRALFGLVRSLDGLR